MLVLRNQSAESMSYWNSGWARFMGATEEVQPRYQEPDRDSLGNLSSMDTMMSSQCFNFSRTVQARINEVLFEMVTSLQISPDMYMNELLSGQKQDWKAATLLIIKIDLMHLADQLTPIHTHCAPRQYQQMQLNRANFEKDHGSAIHSKIQQIFAELISVTLNEHDRDCFERKQQLAWQYLEWACAEGMYDCSHYDIQKIRKQMPHWL